MSSENPTVTTRVHPDQKNDLERIAYEKSSPGDRVYCSQVIREAINDYIEQYDESNLDDDTV